MTPYTSTIMAVSGSQWRRGWGRQERFGTGRSGLGQAGAVWGRQTEGLQAGRQAGGLGAGRQQGSGQTDKRACGRQAHLASGCPALHGVWILLQQSVTLKLAQAADVTIQRLQQMLLSPLHLYTHWHVTHVYAKCHRGLMGSSQQAQGFTACHACFIKHLVQQRTGCARMLMLTKIMCQMQG